jgi:hypothetical protein
LTSGESGRPLLAAKRSFEDRQIVTCPQAWRDKLVRDVRIGSLGPCHDFMRRLGGGKDVQTDSQVILRTLSVAGFDHHGNPTSSTACRASALLLSNGMLV